MPSDIVMNVTLADIDSRTNPFPFDRKKGFLVRLLSAWKNEEAEKSCFHYITSCQKHRFMLNPKNIFYWTEIEEEKQEEVWC